MKKVRLDPTKCGIALAKRCASFHALAVESGERATSSCYRATAGEAVTWATAGKTAKILGVDVTELIAEEDTNATC